MCSQDIWKQGKYIRDTSVEYINDIQNVRSSSNPRPKSSSGIRNKNRGSSYIELLKEPSTTTNLEATGRRLRVFRAQESNEMIDLS